jgi:hypothetical protein
MNVHVDAAWYDQAARCVDDLGTGARRTGQTRADRRDRFASDRHVGLGIPVFTDQSAVRDDDIVIHECGFSVSHEIVLKTPSIARTEMPVLFARNRSAPHILLRKTDRKSTISRAQALFPPL